MYADSTDSKIIVFIENRKAPNAEGDLAVFSILLKEEDFILPHSAMKRSDHYSRQNEGHEKRTPSSSVPSVQVLIWMHHSFFACREALLPRDRSLPGYQ